MRSNLSFLNEFEMGLRNREFVVHYQPIFNHDNKTVFGAEALVRWQHPTKGLLYPSSFISEFEASSFIGQLDIYVFEEACRLIAKREKNGQDVVPISVNFSRQELFYDDFVSELETIRTQYGVDVKNLRIEITEGTISEDVDRFERVFNELHSKGYVLYMDDFGSAYSSLNVLMRLPFDAIKLDMKFFQGQLNDRGGIIISSVVRMAKLLNLVFVSEGVETLEQAEFMKSIGTSNIQGYLYSEPVPEAELFKLLDSTNVMALDPPFKRIDPMKSATFWTADSLDSFIFNNFAGGACIFAYKDEKIELLRVNQKCLKELGMNPTEKSLVFSTILDFLDQEGKTTYLNTIKKAIESDNEEECETWWNIKSPRSGRDQICIRSTMRVISQSESGVLVYCLIRDVTNEKEKGIVSKMAIE